MNRSIVYKGYEIRERTTLSEGAGWSTAIEIIRSEEGKLHVAAFHAGNTFPTEEGAVKQCWEFGRNIIDGKVPEIPTGELP